MLLMTLRRKGEAPRERGESRVTPGFLWGYVAGRCFEVRVTQVKGRKLLFSFILLCLSPAVLKPAGVRCVGAGRVPHTRLFGSSHARGQGIRQCNSNLTLFTWRQHQSPHPEISN